MPLTMVSSKVPVLADDVARCSPAWQCLPATHSAARRAASWISSRYFFDSSRIEQLLSIHLFDGRVVEEDAAHRGQKDLEESGFQLSQ